MVQRRSHRGMAGGAADHPGRAALVLPSGDPDGADLASRVPPRPAPNGGADRLHPAFTRSRSRLAGPQPPQPPSRDAGGTATGIGTAWRARPPAGGQHGAEAVWLWRVAGREACPPRKRRSWKKLHIGRDAGTGRIVAAVLTDKDAVMARRSVPCSTRPTARSRR